MSPLRQCNKLLFLRPSASTTAATLQVSKRSISNVSYIKRKRPPLQRHSRTQQNHSYHSSSVAFSSTINKIKSFKRDEDGSLHFIISSRGSKINVNDDRNEGKVPTKIFSPALFLPTDVREGIMDLGIEYDSSSSSSVRDEVINDISAIVESHYTLDDRDQFVGGMGENDGGVWFVADYSYDSDDDDCEHCDTLDYWEHIRDVISSIKQNRHGIPFGIYTSGLVKDKDIANDLKGAIGISSLQVTLGSGDPSSYGQVVGLDGKGSQANSAFGEVCNFIVSSAESGFPVTAAVASGKHAGPGGELAKALGAVDVVVYDQVS